MVELALTAPILLTLLFGITEVDLLFKDVLILNDAAREGCRDGAIGGYTTSITATVMETAASLNTDNITVTQQYGTLNEDTQSWEWTTLGDVEDQNSAPGGAKIKITLTYPHTLISAGLLPVLPDEEGGSTITISATSVMRRE